MNSGKPMYLPHMDAQVIASDAADMSRTHELRCAVLKRIYVDSFIAHQFRRPPKQDRIYPFTSLIAEFFYSTGAALIYPSVAHSYAANLALPSTMFDERWEVLFTYLLRIEACFGFGAYEYTLVKSSWDFEADGTIKWENSRRVATKWTLEEGLQVIPGTHGWRATG